MCKIYKHNEYFIFCPPKTWCPYEFYVCIMANPTINFMSTLTKFLESQVYFSYFLGKKGQRCYMWNKLTSKFFQLSSMPIWNNLITAGGNLPEGISKSFQRTCIASCQSKLCVYFCTHNVTVVLVTQLTWTRIRCNCIFSIKNTFEDEDVMLAAAATLSSESAKLFQLMNIFQDVQCRTNNSEIISQLFHRLKLFYFSFRPDCTWNKTLNCFKIIFTTIIISS